MGSIIIIPTYNEAGNIRGLIEKIHGLDSCWGVLIIDDNSTDGTGKIADELSAEYKEVEVIHRKSKLGIGSAYILGFRRALEKNPDYIITMDADFSHNPEYLTRLINNMDKHDVLIGSRYLKDSQVLGCGYRRKVLSYSANLFTKFMLRLKINDFTSGFRCYKSGVLRSLNLNTVVSDGYFFQVEIINRCWHLGYNIGEVPIVFIDRVEGLSKISRMEIMKAILGILKLRWKA